MNPYQQFVADISRAIATARSYPLGGFAPAALPELSPEAPTAMIFAPHPDDECIIGGLALRLRRELKMRVINVAVTMGSRMERRHERYMELAGACRYIGFDLLQLQEGGLEGVTPQTRQNDSARWQHYTALAADIIKTHKPLITIFPHTEDGHEAHKGTSLLAQDALAQLGEGFSCYTVETEFWRVMAEPNLLLESSEQDLADLIAALSFHVGEVQRNPYHLSLPAWMIDNVRRGSEIMGEPGGAAPTFTFGTLYRLRKWQQGRLVYLFNGGKKVSASDDLSKLFQL